MKQVIIFGTGGLGRLARVYFSKDSPYDVAAFTVHEEYLTEKRILGLEVIPFEKIETTHPPENYAMFVAIGYMKANRLRAEIYESCKKKKYDLISYISSKSVYWGELDIGDNCFILENAIINPFVTIGNNVVITPGALVSHHCKIGDHCFLGPYAVINGSTSIGDYSLIGSNTTIADGINVGSGCIIAAGSIINKDTEPNSVYFSESAKRASSTSDELINYMKSPFFRD